jgi:hypothetical protein
MSVAFRSSARRFIASFCCHAVICLGVFLPITVCAAQDAAREGSSDVRMGVQVFPEKLKPSEPKLTRRSASEVRRIPDGSPNTAKSSAAKVDERTDSPFEK